MRDAVMVHPRRIGRHAVLAIAFEGAASVVYRCRDLSVPREVAVKAVRPDAPDPAAARGRLATEAHVRASVQDPHILPLYRAVRSRDGLLLVAPWLAGGTLEGRGAGPLPLATVLALADGLGGALDALHAAGWVHGDLNAGNVLFDGGGRAVLADFGCARHVGSRVVSGDGPTELTTTLQTLAPEAWAGAAVDGRADVYGLGVLLYRALTGTYPFDDDEVGALARAHRAAPVPPPSLRAATVGAETELVLLRSLAKSPELRFAGGAELAAALRSALRKDGLIESVDDRPPEVVALPAEGSSPLPFAEGAIDAAATELERFAATLGEGERAALSALLERARAGDAAVVGGVTELTRQVFGTPAALLALEESGAAEALAQRPLTVEETAVACGAPAHALGRVMEVLVAAELLGRDDGRHHLPPPLAALYRSYRRVGATARPIRDAVDLWAHLSHWTKTREPRFHSDQADGGVYARVVGVLGTLYAGAARELASELARSDRLPAGARVLDVGAGSGIWSIALAMTDPAVQITALDRSSVLEMTRLYAEASGVGDRLHGLEGDWRDAPLPPDGFEIALLANICHLESAEDNQWMIGRTFDALRPGGRVVIVDTIPDRRREASLSALLQGLDLAMRTPGGGVYDRESYVNWLRRVGFEVETYLPLHEPTGRLAALIARRPASS